MAGLGLYEKFEHAILMVLTALIAVVIVAAALEVKRSLLIVVTERHNSIVQVRTVVLLAMLAMVRKLIILDLATTAG